MGILTTDKVKVEDGSVFFLSPPAVIMVFYQTATVGRLNKQDAKKTNSTAVKESVLTVFQVFHGSSFSWNAH